MHSTDVPEENGRKSSTSDAENPGGFVHIPALDGVRGVAILLVLVYHVFSANTVTGSAVMDLVQRLHEAMYIGVNLFFALSGFLITGILLDTLSVKHYFRTFYSRRSLRIFPLYYGSLLFLFLLTGPMHFQWSGWQYYYLTYTSNLAVWRRGANLHIGAFNINHFWSLQVEEQFYLVWPFVVYRIRRPETLARISMIGCGVVLLIRIFLVAMRSHPSFDWPYLPYSPTFSCADNILFGCALCTLLRTRWRATVLSFAPKVFAGAMAVLAVTFALNHGLSFLKGTFMPTFGFSVVGVASAALIAMALRGGSRTKALFERSFLRFFGKYSYGLYVFHYSIASFLSLPIRLYVFAHYPSKALGVLVSGLITLALSVGVAWLSYHLYELQFLRLKRFFSYQKTAAKAGREQETLPVGG